jgi:uncharacterized protein
VVSISSRVEDAPTAPALTSEGLGSCAHSGVPPLVAAAGVGYGEGFAGNTHNFAPTGMMAAMHNAAARGDVETILYLVAKGADPKTINRGGKTTADMANGPVQRIQPWPEALALLEKLGAVNNHRCVSC